MIQNYLKIALRNLQKNRLYAFLNIVGLALGLACCFLVILFIRHERSYDDFQVHQKTAYRVNYHPRFANPDLSLTRNPAPMAPLLAAQIPEIQVAARMYPRSVSLREPGSNQQFEMADAHFADPGIFQILTFQFLEGNANSALNEPFSLVLNETNARKLFGGEAALGKSLYLANQGPFEVTGVVRDWPSNAHLRFDFLTPYTAMYDIEPGYTRDRIRDNINQNWVASHSYTYLLLAENAQPEVVASKMGAFIRQFGNPQLRDEQDFSLLPVRNIHLESRSDGEPVATANPNYLRIFLSIGLLTLLIACINFINLTTASAMQRVREVSLRKVMGAGRGALIRQYLGESLLMGFGAFLLSLGLVALGLPLLNRVTGTEISLSYAQDWPLLGLFAGIFILAGLLAGGYPAWFISRFQPVAGLKGISGAPGGVLLRKMLTTMQFFVAIALITGTIVIYSQLDYLRNFPLGFEKDSVLQVPLFSTNMNSIFGQTTPDMRSKTLAFEDELLKNSAIQAVTQSQEAPGSGTARRNFTTDSIRPEDNLFMSSISVDYDFAKLYGIQILAGRDFDKSFGTDHIKGYMISEQAVKTLGWKTPENAVGKNINMEGRDGQVVGVFRDFHFSSLHGEILPLALVVSPNQFNTFSIRLQAGRFQEGMAIVQKAWTQFFPEKVFEPEFLSESLANNYEAEQRLSDLIGYFALLAILISCFGLFGLATFTAFQKTKEIGIRKVLGASVLGITGLLAKDFLKWVVIAVFLASPVAYYFMKNWLSDFAYRIELQWWMFGTAALAAVCIAFLTVSFQSIRAALANPVKSLRSE
ncbi:MAG: ABC transporter permease [Phycisphaerae bacterium]|nr:ABC transporter permease [Saprospiraceae bacterium]